MNQRRSVGQFVGNSGHCMINFLSNYLTTLSSDVAVTLQIVKPVKSWYSKSFINAIVFKTGFFFFGTFVKLRKATISFIMCVRWSAGPHGTTRPPLDEFSWYFTLKEFFENVSRKYKFHKNPIRITDTLQEDLCTFMITIPWIFLTIRNMSKNFADKINTHIWCSIFFNVPFIRSTENTVEPDRLHDNIIQRMWGTCRITKARIQTHTQNTRI
jgi:hypothetical protein